MAYLWKTVVRKMHNCYTSLMLIDTEAVRSYFAKLDLEPEIADIYLALHSYGPQTISDLSRNARVERTRIYRLIDRLLASNLIEVESHYKRGIIKAAPIANLHILINEKEQELKSLRDGLGLIEQVLARNSLSSPATSVQFYHGPEGIRQMQWNLFRSKGEILTIMHRPMQTITTAAFFARWAERWNESGLTDRLICDQTFLSESNAWHLAHPEHGVKDHTLRKLDPSVMLLAFGEDIYNDTVAFYNWHEGEVFGVELHNADIAAAQRTFFELLWQKSVPVTDDKGHISQTMPLAV